VLWALKTAAALPTGDGLILVLSLLTVVMFLGSILALRQDGRAPLPMDEADERPAPPVAPPMHRAG
jgi:hypothetical protein